MLSKETPKEELEIYLREVKEAMDTSCNSSDILDSKIHNIINFILPILFGLLAIIFTRDNIDNIKCQSIILVSGVSIASILLLLTYMTRKYFAKGDLMDKFELLKDDKKKYYHNEHGMIVYLIMQYQKKAKGNFNKNRFKGLMINLSIIVLIATAIITFITHIILI